MALNGSGLSVVIDDDSGQTHYDPETGTVETKTPDGGVVVQLGDGPKKEEGEENEFYENLAEEIDQVKLQGIANDIIDAVQADNTSREGYLATRAKGLDLVGLTLPDPKGAVSDGSSPVEGMSTVVNPLLLEAILKGWASSVGEFLPANGPVKIRDDGDETVVEDDLAEALERDFNHYLTKVATEYYPDTSHMILWGPYFGGSGFKKVYRCPMRRRPVSESVDPKDLIVSDTMKDLHSCERITHEIQMRPSVMKRMMLLGAYRDVTLMQPTPDTSNAVTEAIAKSQGTQSVPSRPEDQPYTIWEVQCEIDLPDYAPGKFKDEGIPLPYLVTLDKDSKEILSLRRDWREDDEECQRKRMYVRWPYVPGPGFYGTGLLNILGNSTAAMTAAWREALDAGQFASFPGGLISKLGGRQNNSIFRVAPGEFAPIETNNQPIGNVVMGMPYKDVTPGLMTMIDKITQQAKEVGGTADIPTAEGIQNTPVGSMLAQIEQATKVMQAAHKGMHSAQSEEFDLLLDLFRDNPHDFVRCVAIKNKVAQGFWSPEKFLAAINNTQLVPMSDPNVPSHIHRISKALALIQLVMLPIFQGRFDPKEVQMRCLRAIKEDPKGLAVDPPPQSQQPDPDMMKAQAAMMTAQGNIQRAQAAAAQLGQTAQLKQAELALQKQIAETNLAREMIIHQADQQRLAHENAMDQQKVSADQAHQLRSFAHEQRMDHASHGLDASKFAHEQQMDHMQHGLDTGGFVHDAINSAHERTLAHLEHGHQREMDFREHAHEQMMSAHEREMAHKQHELDKYEVHHPPKAGFASGGAVADTDYLLQEFIAQSAKMADAQLAPREIIRDSSGKPIGVRVADNSMPTVYTPPVPGFASGGAVVSTDFLLRELVTQFAKIAHAQTAPREIVRDASGKPIGVRIIDAIPPSSAIN